MIVVEQVMVFLLCVILVVVGWKCTKRYVFPFFAESNQAKRRLREAKLRRDEAELRLEAAKIDREADRIELQSQGVIDERSELVDKAIENLEEREKTSKQPSKK